MREFSVPPVADIGDTANLADPVWHNATDTPDTVQFARRDGSRWEDVTCARFRDEVVALARGLIAAGIRPGDRIALMSRTRYEWTLIDYAIWATAAVTVPVYETSSPEQVAWILSDSGAVGCFVETAAHAELVTGVRDPAGTLTRLWLIDGAAADGTGDGGLTELVAAGAATPADEVDRRRAAVSADDVATIVYTSGTTGRPKGCVLSHRNIYFDIANALPGLRSLFRDDGSTLLFLPLAHTFARIIQVGCVQARVRMGHAADIQNLLADLASFRPTFILSVPRVFEKVHGGAQRRATADGRGAIFARAEQVAIEYSEAADGAGPGLLLRAEHALFDRLVYGKLRAALGGNCSVALSGGAPLGTRLAHFYRGLGITVLEGYGLTETAPVISVNTGDANRIGTVGRPLPGVRVRIADDGEIITKGDNVFRRYWGDEAATAEAFDADGWFRTGDLGDLDDDGFLRITGRKKEMIVTAGGKNVAPAVLEDRLRRHPLVSQCMVVGDRQPFIAALVTLDEEVLPGWLSAHGFPADTVPADGFPADNTFRADTGIGELRHDERLRAAVAEAVDYANRAVSQAEAIRSFRILPRDFTEATGELTPSLKVKRNVVLKEYADEIATIYGG
ncbi:MAG: long-chain acyl-CoA synthetase [Micromonosporaceae bacterium]|nr:long-chain acyl-CoA synthetase [Micromonosporaceae bacterium]